MRFAFLRFPILIVLFMLFGCSSVVNLREGIASFRVQDYRQAFIRLMPEARRGQPDAEYAIGYMYYYGQGVNEDRKKAWVWINRAARAGHPDAIKALSMLDQIHDVRPVP